MNYSTYRASLDIHASGSQAVLHAKKGETKRRILITLTERGKPYLISSDCTAVFTATKPDGNIIYNDCAIDNNIICYNFTEQTTAAEGKLDCEIRLYGADNALIISPGFDLIVDAAVYEDGDVIESGTEVSALTALVSEATTLISTVNTKLENGEFNGPKGEQGPQGPKGETGVAGAQGPKGDTGAAGEAGGYYTPAVTQPDENTLRVAFTPSKEDMPAVADTDITLPAGGGGGGGSGEDGGYYAPSVDDEGNLTWTASKTGMPAVDGANIKGPKGDTGATGATGPKGETGATGAQGPQGPAGDAGTDGKSAYAYAVEGGYTGTETEFAAKLAQEKFANPYALTFAGAVTGSYDGSEAVTVEIPSGGGAQSESYSVTYQTDEISEDVTSISLLINDTDMLWKILNADYLTIKAYVTKPSDGTTTGAVWFGIDTNFITKYIAFCKNKKILVGGAGESTVTLVKYIERMPVSKENISVDNKIGGNVNSTGRNCIIHILNQPENSNTVDDSVLKSRIGLFGTARFLLTCDTPVGAGSYIKVTAEKGEVLNA